jgi:L-ascorbate metabolism protein UlaG (beta-lactamase superfamily)
MKRRGCACFLTVLCCVLFLSRFLDAACRDLDLARRFPKPAYAAEPDATIRYYGHNFFQIITSKRTSIITDPLGPGWYPVPSVHGDIVTIGREHFNHNYVALVQGKPLILRGLAHHGAEWNRVSLSFKDLFVYNIPVYMNGADGGALKGAAFVFDLGSVCIAHLGDLSHPLTPDQVKQIGKVDVALTPIGGRFTMGPDVAREVLGQLKPKIAIPMHYRDSPSLVREFSEGFKARHVKGDTLTVSKDALPPPTEIVVLRPRGAMLFE